jgi:hypothetical protein
MDSGGRFAVPIIPALVMCLWFTMQGTAARPWVLLLILLTAHLTVAVGHWMSVDLPRAKATGDQWPAIDAMAADIRSDPGEVAVVGAPVEIRLMLQLALDRPIAEQLGCGGARERTRWLVLPSDRLKPEGFTAHRRVGDYQLLLRKL